MLSPRLSPRVPWLATDRTALCQPVKAIRPPSTWMGAGSASAPSATSAQQYVRVEEAPKQPRQVVVEGHVNDVERVDEPRTQGAQPRNGVNTAADY